MDITDSYFSYNTAVRGGAVYNLGSTYIKNSTFKNNKATQNGGVIYNDKFYTDLETSTISNNQALNFGGVIYTNKNAETKIVEIEAYNNKATNNGGVNFNNGNTSIYRINATQNIAKRGGVNYNNGQMYIYTSNLTSNKATMNGGVNYNDKNCYLYIKSTQLKGYAKNGGANYNNNKANLYMENSVYEDEYYEMTGEAENGGFNYNNGQITMENIEIESANATNKGGVNYNSQGSTITMQGDTQINYCYAKIGGVNFNCKDATITMKNITFGRNNATDGAINYNYGTINSYNNYYGKNNAKNNGGINYNYGTINSEADSYFYNFAQNNGAVNYNKRSATIIMNGDDSWINTNRATRGGVNYNLGTLKMRDFEIYGNFAEANGGVNYNDGGNLTLINVTAGNNEAIRAGLTYNNKGTLTIEDSTISDNNATYEANTIINYGGNCYIYGNEFTQPTRTGIEILTDKKMQLENNYFTLNSTKQIMTGNQVTITSPIKDSSLSRNAYVKFNIGSTTYSVKKSSNNLVSKTLTFTTSGQKIVTISYPSDYTNTIEINYNVKKAGEINVYTENDFYNAINNAKKSSKDTTINVMNDIYVYDEITWKNSYSKTLTIKSPNKSTITGTHSHRFMNIAKGNKVNIENIEIKGCGKYSSEVYSDYSTRYDYVGGVFFNNGTLNIKNSEFTSNYASAGGVIYNNKFVTITNSEFNNNEVYYSGGVIDSGNFTNKANVTITNSNFSSNKAGTYGGAVSNIQLLSIKNSTFQSNSAECGGAISIEGSWSGDGTHVEPDKSIIKNCTFKYNSASSYGGAICEEYARGEISNNRIISNSPSYNQIPESTDDLTVRNNYYY